MRLLTGPLYQLADNAFKEFLMKWGKTQNLSITEQLHYGIRYFDFRMCPRENDTEMHHCHGLYANTPIRTLHEIVDYHQRYPNELLILHYSQFNGAGQLQMNDLARRIHAAFGTKLVPNDTELHRTSLSNLWEKGQNVIVIYENGTARAATGAAHLFWDEAGAMINGWTNSPDEETLRKRVNENIDCRCNLRELNEDGEWQDPEGYKKLFNLAIQPTADGKYIGNAFLKEYFGIGSGNYEPDLLTFALTSQQKVIGDIEDKLDGNMRWIENINIISADVVSDINLASFAINLNFNIDLVPPISELRVLAQPNEAGWFNENVPMELIAVDSGYGVSAVDYQVGDNRRSVTTDHWFAHFEVDIEGIVPVYYNAWDHGFNHEERQMMIIKLDKTGSEITFEGVKDYLLDEDIFISCTAEDPISGLKYDPCTEPLVVQSAEALGLGEHEVTVTATDVADNDTTTTVKFRVVEQYSYDSLRNITNQFVNHWEQQRFLKLLDDTLDSAAQFEREGKTKQRNQMFGIYFYLIAFLQGWDALSDHYAETLQDIAIVLQQEAITRTPAEDRDANIHYLALGNTLPEPSYPHIIADQWHHNGYNVNFIDEYMTTGLTTEQLLDMIQSNITGQDGSTLRQDIAQADVITIDTGIHDILDQRLTITVEDAPHIVQQAADNVNDILKEIRLLNPTADIYVMGLYPAFYRFSDLRGLQRDLVNRIRNEISQKLKEATILADAIFIPTEIVIYTDLDALLPYPDDITLSEAGHQLIADVIWPYVARVPYAWPSDSQLNASQITTSALTLTWDTPISDVTEYVLFNGAERIATLTDDTLRVDKLRPGTRYNFKVEAILPNGMLSSNGPERTVRTASLPDPLAPRLISSGVLKSQIASSGSEDILTYDLPLGGAIQLPGHVGDLLQDKRIDLSVQIDGASLVVPASVLQALWQAAGDDTWWEGQIMLSMRTVAPSAELTQLMAEADLASGASLTHHGDLIELDLTITNTAGEIIRLDYFDEPFQLRLPVVPNVNDMALLGIYYLNENSKQWEYVGGALDRQEQFIEAPLTHFSKYAVIEYDKSYTDVPATHWAQRTIQLLSAQQVVNGMSINRFAPDQPTTRAEFVTMLVRAMDIEHDHGAKTDFADVEQGLWYSDAIAAAVHTGIARGINEHSFAPHAVLSREQMALFLVRAYEYVTGTQASPTNHLANYSDAKSVSTWAQAEVNKAIGAGLMQGTSEDTFAPQRIATRAEAAQAIYNLLSTK